MVWFNSSDINLKTKNYDCTLSIGTAYKITGSTLLDSVNTVYIDSTDEIIVTAISGGDNTNYCTVKLSYAAVIPSKCNNTAP